MHVGECWRHHLASMPHRVVQRHVLTHVNRENLDVVSDKVSTNKAMVDLRCVE